MQPQTLVFPHHTVILEPDLLRVRTVFNDGTEAHACPHFTQEYVEHSREKSIGDPMLYCWQHDLMHVMLAEIFMQSPSPTLWAIAHGEPAEGELIDAEEKFVQSFQKCFVWGQGTLPETYPTQS